MNSSDSFTAIDGIKEEQPSCLSSFGLWATLGTLGRAAHAYSVVGTVLASYRYTRSQDKKLKKKLGIEGQPNADEHPELLNLWERSHELNADRMYNAIVKLRGLWIKVGQFLSSRVDIVPIPYIRKLATLQDAVPSQPWADLEKTLKEDLGVSWRSEFGSIDETPLSSASIAQVHCATMPDGERVVLKVQHRGVEQSMKSDLDTLSAITNFIAKIEPDYDFRKIVEEWKPAVKQELDMRLEAKALEEVSANMQVAGVTVIIPKPHSRLVTKRVLVMEYCDGFPVRDMEAMEHNKVNRHVLMGRICESFAVQMHVNGFFNADPHPGNILVSTNTDQNGHDQSVPILLDFGLTKRFTPKMLVAFARMMHASHSMDVDELVTAFKDMELKLAVDDPLDDLANMRKLFRAVPREKSLQMRSEMRAAREAKMASHPNPKKPVESWPADLVFFFRVTGLLRGLAASLDVEYPFLKTMADAAVKTIRLQTPEHDRSTALVYGIQQGAKCLPHSSGMQLKLENAIKLVNKQTPVLGIQVAVFSHGECVANLAAGTLGVADPRPVTHDTLFNVFSATKGIVAAAALILMQEGLLDLNAPVSAYWPEFAAEGKQDCTVKQLLNHQAGLANALPESATLTDLADYQSMVDFVARAKPEHGPGKETHYHYLTFGWLVGGLAEAASGNPLVQTVKERISEPLSLQDGIYIGIPEDLPQSRLAILNNGFADEMAQIVRHSQLMAGTTNDGTGLLGGPDQQALGMMHSSSSSQLHQSSKSEGLGNLDGEANSRIGGASAAQAAVWERFKGKEHLLNPTTFNMRQIREAVIPAANGHANAHSLARFYATLASKVDGVGPLLNSKTIGDCISESDDRNLRVSPKSDPLLAQHTADFGLGFQVHKLRDLATGETLHSIGHAGVGGSMAFVIPEREISFAVTVNNLTGLRTLPNLMCTLVLHEFGIEAPHGMIGVVNKETLAALAGKSSDK